MANTVNTLNYANTFADWLVATDALIVENNVQGKGDYVKDTGTLTLNETSKNALLSNGTVVLQNQLLSQGQGSSVTIDNNVTVKYGTVYIKSLDPGVANIALVAHGQSNVDGLLFANGPGTGLYVLNDAVVGGNGIVHYTTTTNHVHANSSIWTPRGTLTVSTTTNYLQANSNILTDTLAANSFVYTDKLYANTETHTGSAYSNTIQAYVSTNTEVSFANVSYAQYVTANNKFSAPAANISTINSNTVTADHLSVISQLDINGRFVLNGDTVYNSNTFVINAGSGFGLDSHFMVNRGVTGANADIRWNEGTKYWDMTRGNSYYNILTTEFILDSTSSTSTANVATPNSVYIVGQWAKSAGNYANSAFAAANNVGPQIVPAFNQANLAFAQANSAYQAANLSTNYIVGSIGSVAPRSGVISLTGNNGVTIVATSANNLAIGTPQDLRTSATPTFNSLTLTNPLAIDQGGTGATSATQALTNLLPSGTTAGYVLTTGGPGNFSWAPGGSGGGGGTTPGTSINSTRLSYTANGASGYSGNTFTIPVANQSNQVRAYIQGVRQFESDYNLNLSSNSISFVTTPTNGNKILIEVDGYYVNSYYANNTTFTAPFGGIVSSANTVQLAIQDVETRKMPIAGGAFTGLATGITVDTIAANTAFATTAFVKNALNSGNTYTHSIIGNVTGNLTGGVTGDVTGNVSGNANTVTNGVYTTGTQTIGGSKTFSDQSTFSNGIVVRNGTVLREGVTIYGDVGVSTGNVSVSGTFTSSDVSVTGAITATGDITAFYGTSDRTLKENIVPLSGALNSIDSLNSYRFNYISRPNEPMVGVMAQELQEVYPELVYKLDPKDENSKLAVRYELLTAVLLQSIKELKSEVEELKGKIK